MDWSFDVNDNEAGVPNPPSDVVDGIRVARNELQQEMERCRAASARLAAAVRYASERGVKSSWIASEAGLTVGAVERALAGNTYFASESLGSAIGHLRRITIGPGGCHRRHFDACTARNHYCVNRPAYRLPAQGRWNVDNG